MTTHDGGHPDGRETCDALLRALRQSYPNASRKHAKTQCALNLGHGSNVAYVYHFKTQPRLDVYFSSAPHDSFAKAGNIVPIPRESHGPGWPARFAWHFELSHARHAAEAARFLLETVGLGLPARAEEATSTGATKQGVNHEARAARAWSVLVERAAQRSTIAYSELGQRIGGVHQRAISYTLGPIQEYCLAEKLPPLSLLVLQKGAGRPGGGFIAWDADDIETGLERVYAFPWSSLPNPFAYALDGDTTSESLAGRLVTFPDSAADVYALVRVRGMVQTVFRAALLAAYGEQCAFCGTSFYEALEAAHIVPWTKCTSAERLDPRNGILLCRTHHALFDDGFLTLDKDLRIHHTDDKHPPETYTEADKWFTARLHGKRMAVPSDARLTPTGAYIERRNQEGLPD